MNKVLIAIFVIAMSLTMTGCVSDNGGLVSNGRVIDDGDYPIDVDFLIDADTDFHSHFILYEDHTVWSEMRRNGHSRTGGELKWYLVERTSDYNKYSFGEGASSYLILHKGGKATSSEGDNLFVGKWHKI